MVSLRFVVLALTTASLALAHPAAVSEHARRDLKIIGRTFSQLVSRQEAGSELQLLVDGNNVFRESDPALLKKLTDEGQAPPFMFLGCSDSRVSEGTVFNAKPGTLFTQRNIGNQYQPNDPNAQSVLSYAVAELGVKHIIVMGHYGCGGVGAAIASRPISNVDAANGHIQAWIEPIREILLSSSRAEIVELREKNKGNATVEEPEVHDPGFRALVEENIKVSVGRIAQDSVIINHYAALAGTAAEKTERRAENGPIGDVFIHGWVYDIENGEIKDLGISVGPHGKAIPAVPFASVVKAAEKVEASHDTVKARCEGMCKTRRNFLSSNH